MVFFSCQVFRIFMNKLKMSGEQFCAFVLIPYYHSWDLLIDIQKNNMLLNMNTRDHIPQHLRSWSHWLTNESWSGHSLTGAALTERWGETLLCSIYNTWNKGPNRQSYSVSPSTHNDQIDTFGKQFIQYLMKPTNIPTHTW